MSEHQLTGAVKHCAVCGVEFYTKASRVHVSEYCSNRCRGLAQRERTVFHCRNCGKEFELRPSDIAQGKGGCCSRECQLALYEGDGNPNWRGGIDPGHKRRSAEMELPSTLTEDEWGWLLEYFEHRCAYCGRAEGEVGKLAREHVLPVSRGGGYTIENIVPACTSCNSTKHTRTPEEAGLEFWKERPAVSACV